MVYNQAMLQSLSPRLTAYRLSMSFSNELSLRTVRECFVDIATGGLFYWNISEVDQGFN